MARPSNTAARRAQIVEGLRRVMAEHGYDGASTVRIAESAGLAPGLVHYHFRDKEEILLALVDRLVEGLRSRVSTRAESAASARDRLLAWVDAFLAIDGDADMTDVRCWVMVTAEAARRESVRVEVDAFAREALGELTADAAAALGTHADHDRARIVAATILSATEGALRLSVAAPGAFPRGSAAPTVRGLVETLVAESP